MKYYRVIKDTFMWETGAILKLDPCLGNNGGYVGIEDIWNKHNDMKEYISAHIVEQSPEWFERVYTDNVEKMVYKTKEQLKEAFNSFIK